MVEEKELRVEGDNLTRVSFSVTAAQRSCLTFQKISNATFRGTKSASNAVFATERLTAGCEPPL